MKYGPTMRTFRGNSDEEPLEFTLSKRLARLRFEAGFSQRGLSARMKIGEKLYSSWETGARIGMVQIRFLLRIAVFYGLTIAELLGKEEPKPNVKNPPRMDEMWHGFGRKGGPHSKCRPQSPWICAECKEILRDAERATA